MGVRTSGVRGSGVRVRGLGSDGVGRYLSPPKKNQGMGVEGSTSLQS